MAKFSLAAGLAAGYVLGARAGRDTYEKIAQRARDVWQHPKVQDAAGKAQATAIDRMSGSGRRDGGPTQDASAPDLDRGIEHSSMPTTGEATGPERIERDIR